jgi:hypothetical protein
MSEIKARTTIPVEWSEKTRCPVCSTPGMSVQHEANSPDQLQCRTCGLRFELEMGGNHLYVTHWPISISDQARSAVVLWLTIDELRMFVNQGATTPDASAIRSSENQTQPSSIPLKNEDKAGQQSRQEMRPLPDASSQLANQLDPERSEPAIYIKSLRTLGNSYKQIRTILTQTISTPAELKAALDISGQMERQEQGRQQKKLLTSMGIAAMLLLIMVGAGFFILKIPNSPSSTALPMQTIAQPTVRPSIVDILKLATPNIHMLPPLPATDPDSSVKFPRTLDGAASLFGGLAENWKSLKGGWIMISPVKAVTINVPNGMKAAYLVMSKTVGLAEVKGPARMENVYYVSVSCP